MIENILNEIKSLLEGKHEMNSFDFSGYLEAYLIMNYDEMKKENPKITDILNDEVPDICAMMEPGLDDTEFKKLLKNEYELAIEKYYS